MEQFIPLSVPNLKGNELDYVIEAVKSEWVSTAGTYVTDFEKGIAEYVHAPSAVACQSGTSGLHLALLTCGVNKEDEVIVPTLTFIAAVNPVKYIGAEPIFMDCDDTLTMDPVKLRHFCETECFVLDNKLVNKKTGKQIKAMVVVHVFGNMADMESIMETANQYHLKVIEDATEALGTYYLKGNYTGQYAGTIGDIGVYSFNGNKIITTGGGGMIVSKNEAYLEKCRYLSTQAKDDILYFVHDEIGFNYRMTNLQAALGLAQLEQLEKFIDIKKDNYLKYKEVGIELLNFRDGIRPNYWFYCYWTDQRDRLLNYLNDNKIQVRPIWKLIHTLKPYLESQTYCIDKAVIYYDHILNLPCSSNLSAENVETVIAAIQSFS
ncbi:MAG TPA: LegC family aminotransferase [Mobilitalea sp.]|nr:LegC family aminotransferase [Mobilitalea sp.]